MFATIFFIYSVNYVSYLLSFKPDIDDLRGSPALSIAKKLKSYKYEILAVEPNINKHEDFEIFHYNEAINNADLIAILVAHNEFKILNKICHVVKGNNNLYKFLFTAPNYMQDSNDLPWKTYQERLYSILKSIIDQGCKEGDFIDLNPQILMKAIGGLFHELLIGSKDDLTEKEFEMMISNLLISKTAG